MPDSPCAQKAHPFSLGHAVTPTLTARRHGHKHRGSRAAGGARAWPSASRASRSSRPSHASSTARLGRANARLPIVSSAAARTSSAPLRTAPLSACAPPHLALAHPLCAAGGRPAWCFLCLRSVRLGRCCASARTRDRRVQLIRILYAVAYVELAQRAPRLACKRAVREARSSKSCRECHWGGAHAVRACSMPGASSFTAEPSDASARPPTTCRAAAPRLPQVQPHRGRM
jgi:hypothetical protein